MSKLALVFAGQGAQYTGMGLDFHKEELAIKASKVLGYDPIEVLMSNNGTLNQTLYTQPMVFYTSYLIYQAFLKLSVTPNGFLGFSLGEYSSLCASSVFSFEDALKLIQVRATLMEEQTKKEKGTMTACIGMEDKVIESLLMENQINIEVANYNTQVQTVISGSIEEMDKAVSCLKENGLKRAIVLNVSGAFHSQLMKEAGVRLRPYLETVKKNKVSYDIYMNVTANKLEFETLVDLLEEQVSGAVRFKQSIEQMKKDGYTHFIEIGPGNTLSSFIKKIDPTLEVIGINQIKDIDIVERWLIDHEFKK